MKTLNPSLTRASAAVTALSLALAGCATAQAPGAAPAPTPAAAPVASASSTPGVAASAPAGRPTPLPGALAPFAETVREAKRSDGYLPVWTRDDRTWLEIPAALLDKPFFMASSVAGGTGEGRFWPGLTGRSDMVQLRRVGNTVQLIARNTAVRAPAGTPLARALSESYSDSLLAAAPLLAAPHPLTKALLVDANVLLGSDIFNAQLALEAQHRLPYALDRANSSFERVRTTPAGTFITLRQHFSVPRLPATVSNPALAPNPPRALPDVRSLFIGVTYTLAPLPAVPLQTRAADPRVGYFNTSFVDLGNDNQEGRRTHLIRRWRLEKADPTAEVSAPKEAIRVVLDRNIPEKWRTPVREGVLEWNKAFERAGFRNAVVVEQQPADADWSALEGTRVIAVRWFAQEGPGSTAVGPSQSDPRTGEMLRGAVIIDENRVRLMRARVAETVPVLADAAPGAQPGDFAARLAQEFCSYGQDAMDDASFGLELLAARGQIDPNGPEGDRFVADALKNVAMHELGHVLGLRHNFRASASVKLTQLRDPAYTAANGLSPSVMDYNGQNTPLEGESLADYHMTTLGAYDYWAIEYGYRQWPDAATEKRELAALADRADREPLLAYGTDEDLANNDPLIAQRDMGDDPLAYAQRQIKLARELWQRTTTRALAPGEDFTLYRRTISRVFGAMGTSLPLATKMIGGSYTARVSPAANRPLVQPVPAKEQRAALALVVTEFFGSQSFKFDPQLMMRLGVDQGERFGPGRGVDFSLQTQVLGLQRQALDALMAENLAGRLADAESQVADPRTLLDFAEVQASLSNAVWSELAAKGAGGIAVDSLRRNLQREHVRRLAAGLVRPATQSAADVRPVFRQTALQLQARLNATLGGGKSTGLVRAHLDDCLATLSEALKAPLVKQGV